MEVILGKIEALIHILLKLKREGTIDWEVILKKGELQTLTLTIKVPIAIKKNRMRTPIKEIPLKCWNDNNKKGLNALVTLKGDPHKRELSKEIYSNC